MCSNFHFLLLLLLFLERFRFLDDTIINNVIMRYFKVCPTVWVFVRTINHAKIDPLSQNLDMFLKQIIIVHTPKIMIVCQILFTGLHQNLFYYFLSHYFSMPAPISINLFLLKKHLFYDDIAVISVAVWQFNVFLTVCLG